MKEPTKNGKRYDTLYIDCRFTGMDREFSGNAGVITATVDPGISDHALVWAQFWTHLPDDD
ncbi:hypothetical protein KAW44_02920 [Candidatus Bipolaricaulota bacterium]|nr:hypothetical protein [Candidatus Bipolaricaulota bacterium]